MKYFKPEEFDSPDLPGSGARMDPEFIRMLEQVRELCGFPFAVSSGYRTAKHNTEVGGVGSSSHQKGKAADIKYQVSGQLFKIVENALKVGFKRLGVGKTFVHLDSDESLPHPVIWLYNN